MPGQEYYANLEAQRQRVRQVEENTARLAKSTSHWTTTGWGEIDVPDPFMFNCTFIEEPHFFHGLVFDDPDGLVSGRYPTAQGIVRGFVTDTKGFYIAAYVSFVISTISYQSTGGAYPLTDDPGYTLRHSLAFEGRALKAVPAHLLGG